MTNRTNRGFDLDEFTRAEGRYWRNHYMPVINGLEARLSEATARIKQLEGQNAELKDLGQKCAELIELSDSCGY